MPIIKYVPVHGSPLKLLEYVANENKTKKALITGMNCSADPHIAYKEMEQAFEHFSGQRFWKKSLFMKMKFSAEKNVCGCIITFSPSKWASLRKMKLTASEWNGRRRFSGTSFRFLSLLTRTKVITIIISLYVLMMMTESFGEPIKISEPMQSNFG